MLKTSSNMLESYQEGIFSTVSHELRTPLAAISGNVALLLQQGAHLSDNDKRECLEEIDLAGQRLNEAISLLIETLRTTQQVAPSLVDVTSLAREALEEAERSPLAQAHTFSFVLESVEESLWVRGDAHQLRQALDQVLKNALMYSQGGAIRVRVCQSHMIEITVEDAGIGIEQEHLPRIFEQFFRVDSRLERVSNGLGLGLTFCRRIIEEHGGSIWAESTPGTGSIFHLLLPTPVLN